MATDLDGSLWWHDHFVHPDSLAAWARIEAAGVRIIAATGRREARTRDPLALVGLAPSAVVLNGGIGLHLGTGERFHKGSYGTADAVAVLGAFRSHGLEPCVYVDADDVSVYVAPEPSTHPEHLASFGTMKRVDDLERVVAEEEVLSFSLLGVGRDRLDPLAADLAEISVPHCADSIDFPGTGSLTVSPIGLSKWNGILSYCESEGIDATRVLCVGDGPNDVEMLEACAVAAVPVNGSPEAQAVADVSIGHPDDGGWADIEAHL